MNCDWKEIDQPDANGRRRVQCQRPECGRTLTTASPLDAINAHCKAFPYTPPVPGGPGTELKAALEWWGLHDDGKCGCEDFSRQMDAWGPDGCEAKMPEILDHLREAARIKELPFVEVVARRMVNKAIQAARAKTI